MKQFMIVAALALCVPVFAAPTKAPVKHADIFPTKCPVTGETVASAKDSVGKSSYKGKTYYFCCSGCKPQFDANPAKYAEPAVSVAKSAPAKL